jgi:hypothetical protein
MLKVDVALLRFEMMVDLEDEVLEASARRGTRRVGPEIFPDAASPVHPFGSDGTASPHATNRTTRSKKLAAWRES